MAQLFILAMAAVNFALMLESARRQLAIPFIFNAWAGVICLGLSFVVAR